MVPSAITSALFQFPFPDQTSTDEQRVLPTFSKEEIAKFATWRPKTFASVRLQAIILMLADTGTRIDEGVILSVPGRRFGARHHSPRCGCKRIVMTEQIEAAATQTVQARKPARESGPSIWTGTVTTIRDTQRLPPCPPPCEPPEPPCPDAPCEEDPRDSPPRSALDPRPAEARSPPDNPRLPA
jgi:hypothetical protein